MAWERQVGRTALSEPALADLNADGVLDVIVTNITGEAAALHGSTGRVLWRRQISAKGLRSPLPGVFTEDYRFLTPEQVGQTVTLGQQKMVVNIGSVGQPRDRNPRACYCLVDESRVTWRRVEYDVEATVKAILDAPGLENFNAHRLRDGR